VIVFSSFGSGNITSLLYSATARRTAMLAETSGTKNIYVRLIAEALLEPVAGGGENRESGMNQPDCL